MQDYYVKKQCTYNCTKYNFQLQNDREEEREKEKFEFLSV